MGFAFALWREFLAGLPGSDEAARVVVRLGFAVVLGGAMGLERGHLGKAAGMRTHMLVALAMALVAIIPNFIGMSSADASRVIQGALTGMGFIGGGVILKMSEQHQIVGVTTAAGIWLTAVVGIASGSGRTGLALAGTALGLIVLTLFSRIERWLVSKNGTPGNGIDDGGQRMNDER